MKIHADLRQRAMVRSADLPWLTSPMAGVERRMLERDGGEAARATSLVRYAAGSRFAPHTHPLGEEFLVLEGVFSDEHGDYRPGWYVRNPPGSRHRPFSAAGCVILVKLRQMDLADRAVVRIDTGAGEWCAGAEGIERQELYRRGTEHVRLVRLRPGTAIPHHRHPGGEEVFVLDGAIEDEDGEYEAGCWLRLPDASAHRPRSRQGCLLWVKSGHLPSAGSAGG